MQTIVLDIQVVGDVESTLFTMTQQGLVDALITLVNLGTNTMNYRFQENINGTWTDISSIIDNNFNGTLSPAQSRTIKVTSGYSQVRVVGNASGGTSLWFTVDRFVLRASGGQIPILNL
jgi:hypothetical protein